MYSYSSSFASILIGDAAGHYFSISYSHRCRGVASASCVLRAASHASASLKPLSASSWDRLVTSSWWLAGILKLAWLTRPRTPITVGDRSLLLARAGLCVLVAATVFVVRNVVVVLVTDLARCGSFALTSAGPAAEYDAPGFGLVSLLGIPDGFLSRSWLLSRRETATCSCGSSPNRSTRPDTKESGMSVEDDHEASSATWTKAGSSWLLFSSESPTPTVRSE
jgi:hypothetical protein